MIEPITKEEFGTVRSGGLTEESRAVKQLAPSTGISFPCRWKHTVSCGCTAMFYYISKRKGFKVSIKCHDGVVKVWRDE